MIKKCLSILLILFFAFYMAGHYFVFRFEQKEIKSHMRQLLAKTISIDQCEIVTIPLSDIKKGKVKIYDVKPYEVRINNKYFDYIKKETINDTLYYYGYNDKKENSLVSRYFKIYNGTQDPTSSKAACIIKVLSFVCIKSEFHIPLPIVKFTIQIIVNTLAYYELFIDIDHPPPRYFG